MVEKHTPKYTVGYRKPPKRTRFKPGQSGNPNGRPRKTTTFVDDIDTELRSTIGVLEDGKTQRRWTKGRAIVKQLVNLALRGDLKAMNLLLKCMGPDHFEQPDIIDTLVEELRERNRRLRANDEAEGSASIDRTDSAPITR